MNMCVRSYQNHIKMRHDKCVLFMLICKTVSAPFFFSLVKYAQLLLGIRRLSSENQTYKPYDIDLSKESGVLILGRMVASTHEW